DTPVEAIARLQPDIHCKGAEYAPPDGLPMPERAVIEAYGGRLEYLPLVAGASTSELIRRIRIACSANQSSCCSTKEATCAARLPVSLTRSFESAFAAGFRCPICGRGITGVRHRVDIGIVDYPGIAVTIVDGDSGSLVGLRNVGLLVSRVIAVKPF